MEVQHARNTLAICAIQLLTFRLKNGVVGSLATSGFIRMRVFAHDGGFTGNNLTRHILELGDARKILAHGIVHRTNGLELILIQRLKLHVKRTVRQRTQIQPKEFIKRSGIDNLTGKGLIAYRHMRSVDLHDVTHVNVKKDVNQIVVEHVFKKLGITLGRHALVLCRGKIAIIVTDENRNTTRNGLINLIRRFPPLLHGVVQKNVLIHVVGNLFQFGIVLLAQLHDGNFDVLAKDRHKFLIELLATLFTKGKLKRSVVKRHGHQLAVDIRANLVLVVCPFGKAREELVHPVADGMVDVRTVLMNQDARIINPVVRVSGNVSAALDNCDFKIARFSHTASHNGTGISGTDHHDIVGIGVKTIVLPEGEDPRTIAAAKVIIAENLANLVILGNPDEIDVAGATVICPATDERHEAYAQKFAELRARKGVTIEQARETMNNNTYFATMMVKMGDADGLVSGACHSTADTLRPALQIIKTAPGTKLVSAFFIMSTDKPEFGEDGTLLFADCGLNINPNADELSEIALASAQSWRAFMNQEPRVAMLSYSTMGSAGGETAEKVQEATKLANEKAPELALDGDLQLDAAIVPEVAKLKAPYSKVAGHANILVFPTLEAGNIGYKLVQRFSGAEAYGPLLQGIARPVNDLSRGCSADDIVGVVAITAVQAQMAVASEKSK